MAAYTESIFLFLSLATILSARSRKWAWAGICGALAAITRQQGVFLIFPVLWEIYEACFKENGFKFKKVIIPGLFAGLIPLATFLNFGFVHHVVELPWPWETLTNTWIHNLVFPWTGIIGNFIYLITSKISPLHISMTADLFFSILFIYLLLVKIPKMPFSYRVFGAVSLLPGLIYLRNWGTLTSISRYVVPIFPAFIALAYLLEKKNLKLAWLALSISAQIILLFCFYKWIWVA